MLPAFQQLYITAFVLVSQHRSFRVPRSLGIITVVAEVITELNWILTQALCEVWSKLPVYANKIQCNPLRFTNRRPMHHVAQFLPAQLLYQPPQCDQPCHPVDLILPEP